MNKKSTWNILKYGQQCEPMKYRILKTPYGRFIAEYRVTILGFSWWHNVNWFERCIPPFIVSNDDKYFYSASGAKDHLKELMEKRKKKHLPNYTIEDEGELKG